MHNHANIFVLPVEALGAALPCTLVNVAGPSELRHPMGFKRCAQLLPLRDVHGRGGWCSHRIVNASQGCVFPLSRHILGDGIRDSLPHFCFLWLLETREIWHIWVLSPHAKNYHLCSWLCNVHRAMALLATCFISVFPSAVNAVVWLHASCAHRCSTFRLFLTFPHRALYRANLPSDDHLPRWWHWQSHRCYERR